MTQSEQVYDSPSGWVADHIKDYVESDGENGHLWRGVPTLLLTSRGRRSGKLRRSALIYGRHGDAYVVVASKGGNVNHPLWYLNLRANPEVEIQVGPERLKGRARDATEEERPELWEQMTGLWPDYNDYQNRTDRRIPVVVIDPV